LHRREGHRRHPRASDDHALEGRTARSHPGHGRSPGPGRCPHRPDHRPPGHPDQLPHPRGVAGRQGGPRPDRRDRGPDHQPGRDLRTRGPSRLLGRRPRRRYRHLVHCPARPRLARRDGLRLRPPGLRLRRRDRNRGHRRSTRPDTHQRAVSEENLEDATTAEVPLEEPTASGPVHGSSPAPEAAGNPEVGSQALREMLERTRQQRLAELRETPAETQPEDVAKAAAAKAAKPSRHGGRSKPRTAHRVARRTVGKLVSGTTANTQPVPIVTALKGTPYQAPVQATEPSEDEARMVLDLAADIAAMTMRAGAGTRDVEVSVIAACTACGLSTVEVDLTSNTLVVHYSTSDGRLLTVMRVNRGESRHYA